MRCPAALVLALSICLPSGLAVAQAPCQALDDSWWTGPLITNSAGAMGQGNMLLESYLYDVSTRDSDTVHSFTYFLYGLTDRLTASVAPDFAWTSVKNGANSSGPHLGDLTLQAQYTLVAMDMDKGLPDIALGVVQNLPTGKYDRLRRLSDGFGTGSYATTLALYSQMLWWMPSGRLLRTRFDVAETFSPLVPVKGASVYGTGADFLGHAAPGNQFSVQTSLEYSFTCEWVLAADLFYSHNDPTETAGAQGALPVRLTTGNSDSFGYAPAIEYNWSPNIGMIAGVRVVAPLHNATASLTPIVALNYGL